MTNMQDWWQTTFPKGRQLLTITDGSGYPVQIAYGEKGTGKPLFLMHGIASWSYGWRHNIDALAQHFRVICFDAKGHGFSDKPDYSEQIGHQIIETKQIILALCDEPAIVVAQSLGALIALGVAGESPELFERLVTINVPIFPKQLPNRGMRLLADLPLDLVRVVDNLRLAKLFTPVVWLALAVERREVLANPDEMTFEEIYWGTYPYLEFPNAITNLTEELQQSAKEIEKLLQNRPNIISKIQAGLVNINFPTLILWGEKDSWFPPDNGEKLHAYLSNSEFKIIPNCGHDASSGSPDALNVALLEFLLKSGHSILDSGFTILD
jgi:pimeloyl-ACP methyl ester carboxylesterase